MAVHHDQPKVIEDPQGMLLEYVDQDEAEFLYEEVFVRRSYLQHGLAVEDGAVVVDAGANIGVFSLHCLREAKAVQIYAFEPIPVNYSVLVRNLFNTSSDSVKAGACPKPVALRVALGADRGEEEFHFFEDNPGESTRHLGERQEQRQTLNADPDAASWRQTLGPPLEIATVDLLKVDVEGDELAVLHGIDDDDWPKIRQVALEVHDVEGRLAAVVGLLKSKPAAFDEVCWEPQLTSEVNGYVMIVPKTLKMFLVYAKRRRQQPAKPSSNEDGSASMPTAAAGHGDGSSGGVGCGRTGNEDAGAARLSGVGVEKQGGESRDTISATPSNRLCSCASACCSPVLPT
eukprot:g7373.t1